MVRRLARWVVVIVCLQVIVLSAANTYLLGETTAITSRRSAVDVGAGQRAVRSTEVRTTDVALPDQAQNVAVSYDYTYAAYGVTEDSIAHLEVLQIADHAKPHTVALPQGADLSFLQWLPDRQRLFYMVRIANGSAVGDELQLWYYDVSLGRAGQVKAIEGLPVGSKPRFMSMSTFTNLLYLTVDGPDGSSDLYRIDIMGDCRKLRLRRRLITGLQVLPKSDVVYLEEGETGKILVLLRGSIQDLQDASGKAVVGRVIGCGPDEELVAAGYTSSRPGGTVDRLIYGDEEGRLMGQVGLSKAIQPSTLMVAGAGDVLNLGNKADGSTTIRTQDRRLLWTFDGQLVKTDRDSLAYTSGGRLTVKTHVFLEKGQ